MSEADMRGKVTSNLKHLNAIAVENPVGPGTPDVNYVDGWIELKWVRKNEMPKRDTTIFKLEHYTPQQRIFAIRRRKKGGRCFMLIQCQREWVLLHGEVAAKHLNFTTWNELKTLAIIVFDQGIKWDRLTALLTAPVEPFRGNDE